MAAVALAVLVLALLLVVVFLVLEAAFFDLAADFLTLAVVAALADSEIAFLAGAFFLAEAFLIAFFVAVFLAGAFFATFFAAAFLAGRPMRLKASVILISSMCRAPSECVSVTLRPLSAAVRYVQKSGCLGQTESRYYWK